VVSTSGLAAIFSLAALLRAGIERILTDAGHEVVAGVSDATNLLRLVNEEHPDLAIVDVRMPPTNTDDGLRAALELRERVPETSVLVLSQYVEERYAHELIGGGAGGVGYLLKDRVADVERFVDAVARVGEGGSALDPEVVAQLLIRRHSDPLDRLTPRELDVLRVMAEGRSNAGIAAALVISESAVAKHINSIFAKLGLHHADTDHRRVLAVLHFLGGLA